MDTFKILTSSGKLTMWCIGIPPEKSTPKKRRNGSETVESESEEEIDAHDNSSISLKKRKVGHAEERSARVKSLKARLQQQHGSDYSAVQYTLWAEMLVGETHDNFDSLPQVPMFGMKRARGRCSTTCNGDLNAALVGVADKIVSALSPQPTSSSSSPTSKNVELRSKYIQQLRELF